MLFNSVVVAKRVIYSPLVLIVGMTKNYDFVCLYSKQYLYTYKYDRTHLYYYLFEPMGYKIKLSNNQNAKYSLSKISDLRTVCMESKTKSKK